MSYQANVYEIFIASPSDVSSEREIIRNEIEEWNILNSKSKNLILQPLGWENNVYSQMGDRPQEIINKQILEDADLLIGVFWTRIGSPTGTEVSGTVEEIKKNVNLRKPAMIFFSSMPIRLDSVNQNQYESLKEFKDWVKNNGVFFEYNDYPEFSKLLRRQMSLIINSDSYFKKSTTAPFTSNKEKTLSSEVLLSEMSKLILKEASKDPSGRILKLYYLGGMTLQTNGRGLKAKDDDPRGNAELESALEDLVNRRLIREEGYKGEVYKITSKGYEVADLLDK